MAIDISQRIQKMYPSLSKGHKKIANAVINEYETVAYMTAAHLGNKVGVSESTVVRFAGVLGYEGYSEFQTAVEELAKTKLTPNQRIDMTKKRIGKGDILDNVINSDINKIRHTLEKLDRSAFYKAVDYILEAKIVYIIGARSSEPVAKILNYNLSLIFDNVKFVNAASSAQVFEQTFSMNENDVLIAFSFPRYSARIVNAVKFAKSKGAKTIAFTDSDISPLAPHSDCLLLAQSDMASFMDSLVAPISLINALIVEITSRREKEIRQRFDMLEDVWSEYGIYAKI